MRPSLRRTAALTLAGLLLAPPILAQEVFSTLPSDARESALRQTTREAPADDCTVSGDIDPDGAHRRRERARTTTLFAASHPSRDAHATVGSAASSLRLNLRRVNYIDDEILGSLDAAQIAPAPLSSDAEFLRRVTLDLTGRIPDVVTSASFLADPSGDKRRRLVDRLLASPEFVDRWAFYYDEMFRNTSRAETGALFAAGRNAFHGYFVDAVRVGKGFDWIATELITAKGDTTVTGAANFEARHYQNNGPIQDSYDNLAATVGTTFLGTNALFCASCHHGAGHMDLINVWGSTVTRQDFWGLSAFFARLPRLSPQNQTSYLITEAATGDYKLNTTTGNKSPRNGTWTVPSTLKEVKPRFLLNGAEPKTGEGYRQALARIVTEHPQFARSAVNYLWRELFTVGIVEPADGFDLARQDPANPPPAPWTIQPTHPNLLNRLEADYRSSGYDLRHILRQITSSTSYQLSSHYPGEWKDDYARYFARHFVRRLRAEELVDAIARATNVPAPLVLAGTTTSLTSAHQLPDTTEPADGTTRNFLDTFLRGNRDTTERSSDGSITQALAALNSGFVASRVRVSTAGSLTRSLTDAKATPVQIVRALYLSTLSRPPSPAEEAAALKILSTLPKGATANNVVEDLQFALLNKLDFLFNY